MAWGTITAKSLDDPLYYQDWEDVRTDVNLLRENFNVAYASVPAGVAGQLQVISDQTLGLNYTAGVVRPFCSVYGSDLAIGINAYVESGYKAYVDGYSPYMAFNLTTGDISLFGTTSVSAGDGVSSDEILKWDESDDKLELKKDLDLEANNLITTGDISDGTRAATLLELLNNYNAAYASIPSGVAGQLQVISDYTLGMNYTTNTVRPFAFIYDTYNWFGTNFYNESGSKAYKAGYSPHASFRNDTGDFGLYSSTSVSAGAAIVPDLIIEYDKSDDEVTVNGLLKSTEDLNTTVATSNAQGHLASLSGALSGYTWSVPSDIQSGVWIVELVTSGGLLRLLFNGNAMSFLPHYHKGANGTYAVQEVYATYGGANVITLWYAQMTAGSSVWAENNTATMSLYTAFKIDS